MEAAMAKIGLWSQRKKSSVFLFGRGPIPISVGLAIGQKFATFFKLSEDIPNTEILDDEHLENLVPSHY
jgi:hypothetical protein